MKISLVLMFAFILHTNASVYSQSTKLSFAVSEMKVKDILKVIESKSNFRFFYNDELTGLNSTLTISSKEENVQDFLKRIFAKSKLTFKIFENNVVVITPLLSQQQQTITGAVKDVTTGEPLIGVSISIEGKTRGTVTDANGKFTLDGVTSTSVLLLSYIGYVTERVTVGEQTNVDVNLIPDIKSLNDVVVIGYGTVKKRDLTGSVVSVKGEELTNVPVTTITEALQGKIPGADITRSNGYAGSGSTFRLRGNRSISNPDNSNNPLYIVDGVQGVPVDDINPNDIQSIDILKDASSTAIYGSRGANGVIIITTKRGTSEKARINFNSYAGISEVSGYGQYMDGPEYVAFKREAYRAAGKWNSTADDANVFNSYQLDAIKKNQYTNWTDLLLHNGQQQSYQLSVTGGSEKTKVYFSGSYYDEQGLLKMDEYKRYSGRLNMDQTLSSWLKAGMQAQVAYINNDVRRDPLAKASAIAPLGTPYDSLGNFILYPLNGSTMNPLADEQPNAYSKNNKTTRANIVTYLELTPLKGLSLRSNLSAMLSSLEAGSYFSKNSIDGAGSKSGASVTNTQNRSVSWENILTYNKEIGDHSFTLTGVTTYNLTNQTSSYGGGNNQIMSSQLFYNLTSANQNMYIGSGYSKYVLLSYTGRINYSYQGKYLLSLTGRNDGSSKLGDGHKWAFFPSAALAWRISDEHFMENQNIVSELKLRASYGISGNDVISPYQTLNSLSQIQMSYDETNAAAAYAPAALIGNKDLKWELTATSNFGLDFGILKNRITGNVDYYDARTSNLIFSYTMPPSTGVGSIYQNIGKTKNTGLEIGITSHNIDRKNFTWTTTLSFAKNKEQIVELPNGNVISDDYRSSLIKGQPATIFYDLKKIGIWQTSEATEAAKYGAEPGDIKFADISGPDGVPDGKITTQYDRTVVGSRVPKWTGGLNNDFTCRGFDLNINMFTRYGQWISSDYYAKFDMKGANNGAKVNYWTPENPTNEYPRPNLNKTLPYITTLVIRDASYLKIRNVTLGYTLPKKISEKIHVDKFRVYVSGKNLYTFSKLKDFDPEGEGAVDHPLSRLYVVGLNLTL